MIILTFHPKYKIEFKKKLQREIIYQSYPNVKKITIKLTQIIKRY